MFVEAPERSEQWSERNHPTIHLAFRGNSEGFKIVGFTWEGEGTGELGESLRLGVSYYRMRAHDSPSSVCSRVRGGANVPRAHPVGALLCEVKNTANKGYVPHSAKQLVRA
jgi:hypothetical protein